MIKTIEDLTIDVKHAADMVDYWTAAAEYHRQESHKAEAERLKAARYLEQVQNELTAAQGEPS